MKIIPEIDAIKDNFPKISPTDKRSTGSEFGDIFKKAMGNSTKSASQVKKISISSASPIEFDKSAPLGKKQIGKIISVQGEVSIRRRDMKVDTRVEKGFPLFEGDTLITREKGRVGFKLNDESTVTLAPKSTLAINRSVYNTGEKTRSSSVNLIMGKARFWVKKLFDFKDSEFTVKTSTATCGVRGSDFVVNATSKLTEVTTFENTRLEVLNLVTPGAKPNILESLERTTIEEGFPSQEVVKTTPEEVSKMKKEFTINPKDVEMEGKKTLS